MGNVSIMIRNHAKCWKSWDNDGIRTGKIGKVMGNVGNRWDNDKKCWESDLT